MYIVVFYKFALNLGVGFGKHKDIYIVNPDAVSRCLNIGLQPHRASGQPPQPRGHIKCAVVFLLSDNALNKKQMLGQRKNLAHLQFLLLSLRVCV